MNATIKEINFLPEACFFLHLAVSDMFSESLYGAKVFVALPPASFRAIQLLKTKLYANETFTLPMGVGFSQTDESGDCGNSLGCEERESREGGNQHIGHCVDIYMQFASYLLW